ncbi:MAG: DNA-3-methyladenine glycosylase [Candidatus Pacearchaeota archaeon]
MIKNKKINKNFIKHFYDAEKTANYLLGKNLCRKINGKILKAKIVETEAYFDEKDPASRACKNGDLKETMKMKAGTILVYGVHNNWLINIVTGKKGKAQAVLIRAVEPLNFKAKTNGPGLLTKSLFIDKKFHKKNIFDCKELYLEIEKKDKRKKEFKVEKDFRIGVKKDLYKKLRFYIKGNDYISKKDD